MYRLTANREMARLFNLRKVVFYGKTVEETIKNAIGSGNYAQYIPEQSPLIGGKKAGSVYAKYYGRLITIALIEKIEDKNEYTDANAKKSHVNI